MLPPEVETGEAQDCRVDIWSLGQILYQLLSEPNDTRRLLLPGEDTHWITGVREDIKTLASAMTDPSLEHRPSIKSVLEHSWLS